jgi:hypothetical protein
MGRSSHLSFGRAVPVALLLALAAPAVAHADATITVTGTAPNKTLTFTVDDALDHHTWAYMESGDLVIVDYDGMTLGASGCTAIDTLRSDCGVAADFDELTFAFGGGDDHLNDTGYAIPLALTVDGGSGNDVLGGGTLDDVLDGGPGADIVVGAGGDDDLTGDDGNDVIRGEGGVDLLDGGDGDDYLAARENPAEADYEVSCGAGNDIVLDYSDGDPIADNCETVDPPYLDGELRITGDAQEGNALGLSLPENLGSDGAATIQWERCSAAGSLCGPIPGATGSTYPLTRNDVGLRLRARYQVDNALGSDWMESEVTAVVAAPLRPPPTPRPPRPTTTRPPRPMPMPFLVIPPLAVTRKPYFAIRNGDPVVDTGRAITCPGVFGGAACRLKVAAVPTGATAHVHGRPSSLGKGSELVAATASHARVRVPLNLRAYRLLRAKRKLTLLVTVTVTRPYSATVQSTFTITVRTPAHKRR